MHKPAAQQVTKWEPSIDEWSGGVACLGTTRSLDDTNTQAWTVGCSGEQ